MVVKIKPGDIVKLISGGPAMSVHGVHYDVLANEYVPDMFDCVWFERDNDPKQDAHYGPFSVYDLVIVAANDPTPLPEKQPSESTDFTPSGSNREAIFLEGAHSRSEELFFAINVFKEFIYGFRKLHFLGACVTIFGSARFPEAHPYYQIARNIAQQLAQMGFTIMTGGGPGIMEAANRGAKEAGGRSIGCNIVLPKEQKPNKYLDKWVAIDYFFIRKILLTKYSYAFVVMPGGYGTMDEFFESMTMIQTGKSKKFPVILMGRSYHMELYEYLQKMVEEKTISPEDIRLFLFTDSVDEAIAHIKKHAVEGFGLKKKNKERPLRILGERS